MAKLTNKQHLAFVNEYLINGRSGVQAYMKAYPNTTYNSAGAGATRLLKDVRIKAYLKKREQEILEKAELSQQEIIDFLASVMRGEAKDTVVNTLRQETGEDIIDQREIPANTNSRLRSAETLLKQYNNNEDTNVKVTITNDLPYDEE